MNRTRRRWIFGVLSILAGVVLLGGCAQMDAGYELGMNNQYYRGLVLERDSADYSKYLAMQKSVYSALAEYCSYYGDPDCILPLHNADARFIWIRQNKTASVSILGEIEESAGIHPKVQQYLAAHGKLSVNGEKTERSTGTGFAVSDHLVVTARHIVAGADTVNLCFDGQNWLPATVIRESEPLDIAILSTEAPLPHFLPLAGRENAAGDAVFAYSYPAFHVLGNEAGYSDGVISAMPAAGDASAQIATTVVPGSFGSPLINDSGEVIGMLTSIAAVPAPPKRARVIPPALHLAVKADRIALLTDRKHRSGDPGFTSRREMLAQTRPAVCLVAAIRPAREK